MLVLDGLWLTFIAKSFYKKHIGFIMTDNPNWLAVAIFYVTFAAGIIIFTVLPAVEKGSLLKAIIYGVLFGFLTYGTYDFTNWATIKNWPAIVVVIDIVWGMFVCGATATISFLITKWISL
jgi:uncharacterized membrane protein